MLYILPLNDEEQIHFTGGKFVTPEEIEMNSAQYSSFLKEEIDHLNICYRITYKSRKYRESSINPAISPATPLLS